MFNNRRPVRPIKQPPQPTDKTEKVQKVLASCGLGSRRLMETWIHDKRIRINGNIAELGARVGARDEIKVDGKKLHRKTTVRHLIMYHKPRGKIVERGAEQAVFEDLPPIDDGRWLNVGRLDVASEGLLLFTTDGEFAEELAHPRSGFEREYRVRVNGVLPDETILSIQRNGVKLGRERVCPVLFSLERKSEGVNCWYRIVLSEGRNRIVRRIFEEYRLDVSRLLRVRFGHYHLPPDLRAGDWRKIST